MIYIKNIYIYCKTYTTVIQLASITSQCTILCVIRIRIFQQFSDSQNSIVNYSQHIFYISTILSTHLKRDTSHFQVLAIRSNAIAHYLFFMFIIFLVLYLYLTSTFMELSQEKMPDTISIKFIKTCFVTQYKIYIGECM